MKSNDSAVQLCIVRGDLGAQFDAKPAPEKLKDLEHLSPVPANCNLDRATILARVNAWQPGLLLKWPGSADLPGDFATTDRLHELHAQLCKVMT